MMGSQPFATWLSMPVLALFAGQLRPKPRKALVAAHAVSTACWIGVAMTFVAMSVVAMSTNDIHTTTAIYELMATFDITLLPWTNFATFLTGIALSMTTKMGSAALLLGGRQDRHRRWGSRRGLWVSCMTPWSAPATRRRRSRPSEGRLPTSAVHPTSVLWGFGCAMLSLVGALLLSLYKPDGRTRRARPVEAATRVPASQPH